MLRKDIGSYCYRIKGLNIPFQTPPDIERNINMYIDRIGNYTQRLEDSYNKRDFPEMIKNLEAIQDMLQSVYATRYESHTKSLLQSARKRSVEYSEKIVAQAIAEFLLLAIEMQKAQNIGVNTPSKYKAVEKNEEIAHIMSAVGRLIDTGDYGKAQNLVADMKDKDSAFQKLSRMLDSRDYKRAKEAAATLEKEHIGLITKGGGAKAHKTVLAVDDRPEILTSVNAALRGHYKVLCAPSGKVALEIMSQSKIDLFFLDIDMPEMDGFELARLIRNDRNYADTPLLFLTSNSSRDHITRAINIGGNDFIVKPAYNVTLLAKARQFID